MLLVVLLLLAYFAILVWAVIVSIWGIVEKSLDTGYFEQIIVWLTFLDCTIAPFLLVDYREQIRNATVLCLGLYRYEVGAPIENDLQGQLRSLIEKLHEENYDEIYLVSYSFGALLAYDALFPRTELQLDPQNRYSKVSKLITVGFPYDLITIFSPKYYSSRGCNLRDGVALSWLNVFLKTDAFATEFASHESLQVGPDYEQQVKGPNTSCPVLDVILGGGYMAHGYYFSEYSYAPGDACDKIAAVLRHPDPAV
jgi:hypothetical protein